MNKSSKCQAPPIPQDRQGFMIANLSQRDIFKVKKAADLLAEAKRKRNLLRRPVSEDEVIAALGDAAGLWEFMFPGARHELLQLIVGDIVVYSDRISFVLKVDGLKDLASEMAVLIGAIPHKKLSIKNLQLNYSLFPVFPDAKTTARLFSSSAPDSQAGNGIIKS